MGTPAAISVEHLVKRYKGAERNAVDDISFKVAQGSLFALLGPNGAGKTTTISILTTTLAATSGSVTIAGADLAREQSEVRRRVGIIFQKPSLDRALTGEENCRFHAALYGTYAYRPAFALMPQEYRERIVALGALVGLDRDDLFKKISKYSGGMRRKLEIARSLLHRPQVLFLDEPTVGLEEGLRRTIEAGRFAEGAGRRSSASVLDAYVERIAGDIRLARPLRVAVDCGNGVAGVVAPRLLRRLGCEVTELFTEVDGRFPNHHPDPSKLENLQALVAELTV